MGLDSVELVMTIEDKFGISIPNVECEQIVTVQQMADSVFKKIKLKPNKKCLSQIVFYKIRRALEQFENEKENITPNTKTSDLLNKTDLKNDWTLLENEIGLKIPDLVDLDLDKTLNKEVKFLGFKIFDRTEPVTENTLRKFTDWIISMNYEQLISIENISSKYEIERIICGIIEDRIGIPISEIELHHSFTNDLGID
ncbi:phosphopantetheine-binding protein [Tenacibaculum aiptasiae]|uniref:Phosphopantetheine-binding protein n=1 Tax=Tenacibaculum aiptasiae TaxID=426481 RepID=A0A7J5A819_9FLAO|nr:phosphopantetheine-binding protein [Tenacibaculum aiptasiae]KAB1153648.1 phosphopantetheine-binding protein [Tenacibaculum aiptasiae]